MGFRFRRSVKLFPGVRMNVGLRGASLSVGGRGATMNLSRRGVRNTFGIPGTGISWTSTTATAGSRSASRSRPRAMSPRQAEAAQRRAIQETQRAAATAKVEQAEQQQRDLLNCWREMPPLPSAAFYTSQCATRPFTFDEPAPARPIENQAWLSHLEETTSKTRHEVKQPWTVFIVGVVVTATVAVGFAVLFSNMAVAALLLGAGVTLGTGHTVRGVRIRQLGTERARLAWPDRWSVILRGHEEEVRNHQSRREHAAAQWNECERARVQWATRLVDGDVEALNETVGDTLSDLDFPFETECRVAVSDGQTAYVLLDLPEIEDVIPENRQQVLKDGRVREVRRSKQERQVDYAHLVAGLALMMARASFSAGPTLTSVHIAAYTQRRQPRTGVVRDDFVYEVRIDRDMAGQIDPADVDALALLTELPGRIDLGSGSQLKTIERPDWATDLLSS